MKLDNRAGPAVVVKFVGRSRFSRLSSYVEAYLVSVRVPPRYLRFRRIYCRRRRLHPLDSPQGHGVLKAMVNSGIPVRESTKQDVPSLMPLPTSEDGFDWHQRKRRRRPRRLGASRLSPRGLTVRRREVAIRQFLDPSGDIVVAGERGDDGAEVSKNFLRGAELSKGVVNGEGCAAAAVAAAGEKASSGGKKRSLGLGWLLVSDWRYKNSVMEREANGGGRSALERKRRRMEEFSQKAIELREKLNKTGDGSVGRQSGAIEGGITDGEDASPAVGSAHAQIELRPGGRRGRNEALTLRMRVRRTLGVLGRGDGSGSVDRSRRRDGGRTDRRVAGNGTNRRAGRGGGGGGGGSRGGKRRGSGP